MQPIVNDFFCGCGGMGVGFLNAGYKIAGAWDIEISKEDENAKT